MKPAQRLPHIVFSLLLAIATYATAATAQTTPAQPVPAEGCLSGHPNGMYKGERQSTRYEFAAGMTACLEQVQQQQQFNKASLATRTDFDGLLQRQRELNEQLRELGDRVGNLLGDDSPAK